MPQFCVPFDALWAAEIRVSYFAPQIFVLFIKSLTHAASVYAHVNNSNEEEWDKLSEGGEGSFCIGIHFGWTDGNRSDRRLS